MNIDCGFFHFSKPCTFESFFDFLLELFIFYFQAFWNKTQFDFGFFSETNIVTHWLYTLPGLEDWHELGLNHVRDFPNLQDYGP